MDFNTVYTKVKDFADQFANSSAGCYAVEKTKNAKYTVKEDNYLGNIIENKLVKSCLKAIADKSYARQIEDIQNTATELSRSSYPSLYLIYTSCCSILGIKEIPIVYVTTKLRGINALSVEIKGCKMILVSRRFASSLTTDEMKFILGHELGHHQQGNLIGHTVNGLLNSMTDKSEVLGPVVLDTIEVPLKRWCRRSEFNADRAGFLCCQDINVVRNLFLKLGMIEERNIFHQYKETGEDHPLLFTRYEELLKYTTTK